MLDEPTPFLPAHDVEALFRLIREIVADGASVIFVSHDIDEVLEITDRATVLRDGRSPACSKQRRYRRPRSSALSSADTSISMRLRPAPKTLGGAFHRHIGAGGWRPRAVLR